MPAVGPSRSGRVGIALLLAAAGLVYAALLTGGTFRIIGADPFCLVFNSMLGHMLRGRFDVDPAAIGFEAFLRDGRAYAYFGPFPAALRLPLLLLPDWRALPVQRLFCWIAIMAGVAAQGVAIRRSLGPAPARVQILAFATCAFSGAPMLLSGRGAPLYHEPILWGWALAMGFVAVVATAPDRGRPLGAGRACALAALAGCCLLTRASTGAGLLLALGLLLLRECCRRGDGSPWRRVSRRRVWLPALLAGLAVGLALLVNRERWGDPFSFVDLRLQTILLRYYPDRLARLRRYGLFDPHRLGIGLLYYLLPVWNGGLERLLPLRTAIAALFDAAEPPASSLLLTDAAWVVLAASGLAAILRRRATPEAALTAAGLSLPPALMLLAWYLAFRYRVEFEPALVMLGCIGLRAGAAGGRRFGRVLALCCAVQVAGSALAGYAYAHAGFGTSRGFQAIGFDCAVRLGRCGGG